MLKVLLTIRDGIISYNTKPVVSNINLQINRGEHLAITGDSGSGKTVLLNVLAGNTSLAKGQVVRYFSDTNQAQLDYHHHIAFVGTNPHFRNLSNTTDFYYQQRYNSSDADDALTVTDYLKNITDVAHVANSYGLGIDDVVNLLNLIHLADKQIIKLSNGETKRLMIAAALIKNPKLLLLDNPLTGLDVKTRSEFNNIVNRITAAGITIAMVTGADEIPQSVHQVAMLKDGSIKILSREQLPPRHLSKGGAMAIDFDLAGLLARYPVQAYQQVVAMQNIHVGYGDKVILNNISWQIKQGERWALLGPNGAGKSTLLSLINGDNPQAYANDITLFDRKRGSGESIWDIKSKTGFISAELHRYFPADSNCLQVIESGYYDTMGLFRPSDKIKADQALHWMKVLGIGRYARQLLKNVPTGAQRLCLLARAMIKNPVLLILDEPCQGMDDNQVSHFKILVDTICRQTNVTLIYVTHYTQHIPDSVGQIFRLMPPPA